MNLEETLPPWVHAWHEKPKVIVKGGRVLFKSMPGSALAAFSFCSYKVLSSFIFYTFHTYSLSKKRW